ncbi:hypothetical protein [Tianweitania sp.]|uniref:hypothetical protein n=1 Tax=Tianweitania sp. TaxID=2021634 RepID=UPI0028995901|nr:hypothetical protein [Tianweitania sp.]
MVRSASDAAKVSGVLFPFACAPYTVVERGNPIFEGGLERRQGAFFLKRRLKGRSLEYHGNLRQGFIVGQAGKIVRKMAEFIRTVRKPFAVAEASQEIVSDQTEMFFKSTPDHIVSDVVLALTAASLTASRLVAETAPPTTNLNVLSLFEDAAMARVMSSSAFFFVSVLRLTH